MMKLRFDQYNNIVPFGCMCSLTLYLIKGGYRSKSLFFDWVDSNLKDNVDLVNNDFEDYFNESFLVQYYADAPHIITNKKYNLSYVHVFNRKITFNKQRKNAEKYLEERIEYFKNALADRCLLLYYCRKREEATWIENNQSIIEAFCEKYNCDIAFISNYKIENLNYIQFFIPFNETHKPFGGDVSFPFNETSEIDSFLSSHYSKEQREKNLLYKKKTSLIKRVLRRIENFKKDKLVL